MTTDQGPATPGTAARCEVCQREKADTYVSPPAGLCSLRWPSSEMEHWRIGHERAVKALRRARELLNPDNMNESFTEEACDVIDAALSGGEAAGPAEPAKEAVPEIERLQAENASLLESLREAEKERDEARARAKTRVSGRDVIVALDTKLASAEKNGSRWKGTAIRTAEDLARVSDSLAAAEQRAEAAEKRASMAEEQAQRAQDRVRLFEKALRAARAIHPKCVILGTGAEVRCRVCRLIDAALVGSVATAPKAPSESVSSAGAALHDEERPDVAQQVAHAEALVAQAGRSLKALEEKTGVTMHDEERSAPPQTSKWFMCDCGLMVETHATLTGKPRDHKPTCAVNKQFAPKAPPEALSNSAAQGEEK